jgi:FkbM family methyltransferase
MNIYGNPLLERIVARLIHSSPRFRARLQRYIYPVGLRNISLLGLPYLIDAHRELGYWRASRNQYSNIVFRDEMPQLLAFSSLIETRSTFVDAGANIGLWSCLFASLMQLQPPSKVIAFEAAPDTFSRLQANVSRYENTVVHNIGLSDRARELPFEKGVTSGVFQITGSPGPDSICITCRPLDDYISDCEHILLKVDVEGHELETLLGAKEAIRSGRVAAIFVDGFPPSRAEEIRALLHAYRFFEARTRAPFRFGVDHALLAIKSN